MKFLLPAAIGLLAGSILTPLAQAQAQSTGMGLVGSVQSDISTPLPGAAITVIHIPSGARYAAASDANGHFAVANLTVGGPYLIRVGEGGYRSQTVENVFLENGKTANFTVKLDRIGSDKASAGNARNTPAPAPEGGILALAPEAVVGGPVLITTLSGQRQAAAAARTSVPAPQPTAAAPVTSPELVAATPPAPVVRKRYTPRPPVRVDDPIVPGHYDTKTGNYLYDTGTATTRKLANGSAITGVGINSTESYLHRFLSAPQMQVDTVDLTRGWYNFDRVYFEAGKATLTAESLRQLRNVATLLRAYPTSRIKLGGYTDDTGTYKVTKALSEARARTAWASLVEMGISPSRIDARGYGPNYSIASNATEEGRAMNRRLSVKVLHK